MLKKKKSNPTGYHSTVRKFLSGNWDNHIKTVHPKIAELDQKQTESLAKSRIIAVSNEIKVKKKRGARLPFD